MNTIYIPYDYIIDGLLGGLLYVFVTKYGWEDRAQIVRRLGMGIIAGYMVFVAGLPNHLTALGLGYVGIDAMEALLNKFGLVRKE